MKKKRRAIIKLSLILVALVIGVLLCFVPMKIPGTFKTFRSFASDIRLGIDLKGGVYAVYDSAGDPNQSDMSTRLQSTADRLLAMVQGEGYTEATVVVEGARIRVEVPDVADPESLFKILGEPADMTFDLYEDEQGQTPSENSVTGITGKNVKEAYAINYQSGYGVSLTFDDKGAELFYNVTANNSGKYIKIVVNGDTKSIAKINEAIAGGSAVISGNFTYDDAQTLAKQILSGAFDVKLSLVESDVVSASLGADALKYSLIAGIIGLSVTMLLMGLVYRGLGLAADIALLIYSVLLIFFLWAFPWVQLSLPGIAGVILSIGMAVDANVIIFERIKEEYRSGKSINASVAAGFKKSLRTVVDANVTAIIAALVLILLGSGTIRGFGVTLLIGILLSLFSALLCARGIANLFLQINKTNDKFFGLSRETGDFNEDDFNSEESEHSPSATAEIITKADLIGEEA